MTKYKLKIIDTADLSLLEDLGFVYDDEKIFPPCYRYGYLCIFIDSREIEISSGYDDINGNVEILKFYELTTLGVVEKVRDE